MPKTFHVPTVVLTLALVGGLVMWLDQAWPDLVVGVLVAAIAAKGGLDILGDARAARRDGPEADA